MLKIYVSETMQETQNKKIMENLDCPVCKNFGFYFYKTHCCGQACCDDCLFPENKDCGDCPFCKEKVEKKECVPEKTRNLLVTSLYSVMSAARECTSERESLSKNVNSLVFVVGKLVDQIKEQDLTIKRLEDKMDLLMGAKLGRSPTRLDSPIEEKLDEYLQIYIKTITGTTFNINAPTTCTIEDLKRFIESDCGIPVEQQKLIYAGEQLSNDRTLVEYDLRNGSSIHMVFGLKAQRDPEDFSSITSMTIPAL
jgi:hypothetical protein